MDRSGADGNERDWMETQGTGRERNGPRLTQQGTSSATVAYLVRKHQRDRSGWEGRERDGR
jgi:hypothetical protein